MAKPLFSPNEERVVTVLGVASLIGIAYWYVNKPASAATTSTTSAVGTGHPHGGGGGGYHTRGRGGPIRRHGSSRWGSDGSDWYTWDGVGWVCPVGYTLDQTGACVPLPT